MGKIEEAYCTYELAKLLMYKGFDPNLVKGVKPTHQLALAWARSHGYSIEVQATAYGWVWRICKVNGTDICWSDDKGPNDGGAWDDYDECTEAALNYLLNVLYV